MINALYTCGRTPDEGRLTSREQSENRTSDVPSAGMQYRYAYCFRLSVIEYGGQGRRKSRLSLVHFWDAEFRSGPRSTGKEAGNNGRTDDISACGICPRRKSRMQAGNFDPLRTYLIPGWVDVGREKQRYIRNE